MNDDAALWNQAAALLPDAEAQEFVDAWNIGEQEGGLGLLVSALLDHEVAISGTDRARISVLTESWGERRTLAPRLLGCRDDGTASHLTLIEGEGEGEGEGDDGGPVTVGGAERELAGLVLVPWIACTRCGRLLLRAHARESWGELSYRARQYVITAPDRTTVLRLFPAYSAAEAFHALQEACPEVP